MSLKKSNKNKRLFKLAKIKEKMQIKSKNRNFKYTKKEKYSAYLLFCFSLLNGVAKNHHEFT